MIILILKTYFSIIHKYFFKNNKIIKKILWEKENNIRQLLNQFKLFFFLQNNICEYKEDNQIKVREVDKIDRERERERDIEKEKGIEKDKEKEREREIEN